MRQCACLAEPLDEGAAAVRVEGVLQLAHLVQDAPHGPDVARKGDRVVALDHFRRDVQRRSYAGRLAPGLHHLGDAQVACKALAPMSYL